MKSCKPIQSGHSAYFKKKLDAQKCKKILDKEPGQVKIKIVKTNHLTRGKGWLIEAK